jgi:hypothetical protein
MAASQVQGKAALEKAEEKARAMSISTNDPKFNTPLIPASIATLIVHASTQVDAPASLVFRTLRNTDTWRDWNNFVPRVTIRIQPPENLDRATDAEIAELILNTSLLGSVDSDITDGSASPRRNSTSPPPTTNAEAARRASVASGKPVDGLSGAQRFEQSQSARRASTMSGTSTAASDASSRPMSPAAQPAKLVETSSPSSGGVLIHHGGGAKSGTPARSAISAKNSRRQFALKSMYGEPSIRLKVGTRMTFHTRMGLPRYPGHYKDLLLAVTEVSRPDDLQNGYDSPNQGLTRSTTHTLSRSGVYRIVWGTDHKSEPRPRFLLSCEWVIEVRPVMRGDGKEECELRIWEGVKGISASGLKKKYHGYLFERFQEWVLGLRDYCEAMGGQVERRDFVKEH